MQQRQEPPLEVVELELARAWGQIQQMRRIQVVQSKHLILELAKSKEILESFSKDVASSNRNDEVTQLARNHSTTLSRVADYSERKSRWEKEARSSQESYNKARSRVFSEGSNMRK